MRSILLQSMTGLALFAAGCATGPPEASQRGWIGGQFVDVARGPAWPELWPIDERSGRVLSMPDGVGSDEAALLTSTREDGPLARAGLSPGDLVLSVGGAPVEDALDLRERVEALAPGSHAPVTYWRAGQIHTADVVVGRETYESAGVVEIGFAFAPVVDLWPFDDGIDVLHLVRVRWDEDRHELGGPVDSYLRQVGGGEPSAPRQESFGAFLLLVGAAKGKRVISQETIH